jgi:predicted enzyme related to lactoylglutathione lyase
MFTPSKAFSGFSVDDISRAKQFYGDTLGLKISDDDMG